MKKGKIKNTALVAALSISFLFSGVSYASDDFKDVDKNDENVIVEKEEVLPNSSLDVSGNEKKSEEDLEDKRIPAVPDYEAKGLEDKSSTNNGVNKDVVISEIEKTESQDNAVAERAYLNDKPNLTDGEDELKEEKDVSKDIDTDNKSEDQTDIKANTANTEKKTISGDVAYKNAKDENRVVYIAEFTDKESRDKALEALKSIENTNVLYEYNTLFNGVAIETSYENLDKIKVTNGIKSVEKAQQLQPFMNHARDEIGVDEAIDYLKAINAEYANKYDGRGSVIANIDTGVDYRHKAMRIDEDALPYLKYKKEDLKGTDKDFWLSDKIPHAFNYYNGGKITIERYDDGSDYYDPHGMHIAGILAGNDTKEDIDKYNGIDGIAPNAQIFSYKMYSDASNGFAGDETMFHALEDAIKHNVDVVSISSGFTGTGLVGEKYWQAIRALRKAGIPLVVATGNYATSSSSSSWDLAANNDLRMTDTGNVTRTAAHEDAIAVASAKNHIVEFDKVSIGGEDFKYRNIGAFFDKDKIINTEKVKKESEKFKFVYIGKGQDEDLTGIDLKGKIAVMDRIYTKDLKYAFKKATDKGARAIMVVNTVNYYNRDNWTELPAMGYESDDATTAQVFSVSGNDGLKIWNMINPEKQTEVKKNNIEDYKDKLDQYYPLDMASYNANKPNVGDEKELDFKFAKNTDKDLYKENVIVPAGSTSWGPRNDLLLKPDISAPGKNIKSTLNVIDGKSTYGYMSGTSMAAPVVAASTVLVKPKINEMLNSPVLKNLKGDDKIDYTSLTKIALQNTATPMMDPTSWEEKSLHYASPRQQGAGLINVEKAVKNDVIATYKNTDSSGQVNSYGSISLKEIKGNQKYFTIKLHNTSNRPITFKASASTITTDAITDRLKLDETYKDEKSNDGKQIVPEIHPNKVNNASITFEYDTFTIPANSSFDLNAVINVGDAADKNQFVESFIHFQSQEELDQANSNNANKFVQPSLSMPLMGFAGNWNNEPILDKWAWEKDSNSKKIYGYDEDGKPKIPGTLNKGAAGQFGIDKFNPAAVIQNRKDGQSNSLDQNPNLFAFNNNQDLDAPNRSESNIARVYPLDENGNPQNVELEKGLTPSPLVLRSAEEGIISIVNNKGEEGEVQKDLKVISREHFIRGILNAKSNDAKGVKSSKLQVWGDLKWDGLIYNPRGLEANVEEDNQNDTDKLRGQFEPIAEGQYYYKFKYRLTKDYPWQESYIPVKIDNTAPKIVDVDFSNPEKIKLLVKDTYHKAKAEYKNETLFSRDQKSHPEKFEEVANEVWYAGAALVDIDGNVVKDLPVSYAGQGEGRNRKLDKDGNTVYEITGAGDLRGKIIEVIALDGASNFTKIHRIKFADKADENGNISYYLIDPDQDSSKFEKMGEISEEKLKNIKNKSDSNGDENHSSVDEAEKPTDPIEGEVSLEINEKVSTTRPVEEKDLKKIIKRKTQEIPDFINGGTMIVELDYQYDDNGNIIAYEDGSALEYETENIDDLKSKVKAVVTPSNEGGFELLASVKNVSKDAKVYYGNDFKSVEIKARKYDPATKTLTFDLYANINDVNEGVEFTGDTKVFVRDGGKVVAKTTVRMPEKAPDKKEVPPYRSSYGSVIEMSEADLVKAPEDPSKMGTGKFYYDKEKDQYFLNNNIVVRKGYAVRVTTYNPGKTDMIESNGVYDKSDIEKIRNTDPNIRALSETIIFSDSRNKEADRNSQPVLMASKEGFNIIRYQVFKIKVNDKGEAIDKDGNLVDPNSPEKLVLYGQDGIEYTGENEPVKEDGSMLYIDSKPVNLSIDNTYFNPSKFNKIYVRNPEFYLRGKIGDKGGFNWEMRVNESVVDNYLIYGDLHSDNTGDFNVKMNVKDGDIMDWGMKDYATNGFPDEVRDMDGNIFLKTGYSPINTRAIGVHYQFLYDNVKPEITAIDDGNTSIEYAKDKFVKFNISDKRDNEKAGEIQEQHIFVNGVEYKSLADIKNSSNEKLHIKIVAKDFARNTTVKEFTLDPTTGNVEEKDRLSVSVDNVDNKTTDKVISGEDYILPHYQGEEKPGYKFVGWKVIGEDSIRRPNSVIFPEADTKIQAQFEKIEEKRKEESIPTFDIREKYKREALESAKKAAIDQLKKAGINSEIYLDQVRKAKSIEGLESLKETLLKAHQDGLKSTENPKKPQEEENPQVAESPQKPNIPVDSQTSNNEDNSKENSVVKPSDPQSSQQSSSPGKPVEAEKTESTKDNLAEVKKVENPKIEETDSRLEKIPVPNVGKESDKHNIVENEKDTYIKIVTDKQLVVNSKNNSDNPMYRDLKASKKSKRFNEVANKYASTNAKTGIIGSESIIMTALAACLGLFNSKKKDNK